MAADSTARWVPAGRPTRRDLALAALLAALAIWRLATADAIVWTAAAVGFVTFAIAAGPAATASVGTGTGSWFRDISVPSRVLVIVAVVALVSSALTALNVSMAMMVSFVHGNVLGAVAIVGFKGFRARRAAE
ncbi:hypothetical protein JMJ58_09540 [Haloterrigena salifodinae]|uniref:Uncharacterized protein n=1 Tax=Haloterrigena salifodinae TaxID=2675099 RepID=A0A8T8E5E9_9EURY|nr:hypothetical protein [Haloterrigena salifodinae]QRV17085.1 hypothetical protein JMJ58_09540 [Haloterrigena salifodinae]